MIFSKRLCILIAFLIAAAQTSLAQTKFYIAGGVSDIYYHNQGNSGMPSLKNFYYGIEIDKYLDYHYALSTGVFYLEGGYDNNVSRLNNKFIQVPIGIKMASLGDQFGITAGFNINYLFESKLTELCNQDNSYYTLDVTNVMQKIQPDFYFGLLFRLNRVTAQMKFAFSLTNRYSTGVKELADADPCFYGSYYVYELGKDEQSLTAWSTFFILSVRVF